MVQIKQLKDDNGNQFYPITSERAIVDEQGVSLESKMQYYNQQESDRQSNESQRQLNEQNRQSTFTTFMDSAETSLVALGADDYPVFDVAETYTTGQMVIYNKKLYKFIQKHNPGVWTGNDVVETNIFFEFDSLESKFLELVNTCNINLTISGGTYNFEDKYITVLIPSTSGEIKVPVSSNGQAKFGGQLGLTFTLQYPSIAGYYDIASDTYTFEGDTINVTKVYNQ